MNDIEQIEITLEEARGKVNSMEAVGRLLANKDFKHVIDNGYFFTEAARLVMLKADPSMGSPEAQRQVDNQIMAVGTFRQYLSTIIAMGRTAEMSIAADEETREELLAEEL